MVQKTRPQAEMLSGLPQPNFTGYGPASIVARRDPAASDTGYPLGQIWVNKVAGNFWGLSQVAAGVATWVAMGAIAGAVFTLTGDSGGALSPSSGNINILGGSGLNVAGSGSTLTINTTGGGFEYTVVTGDTQMAVNLGYITNKAGTAAVMTLPVTSSVGAGLSIVGLGATGWSIAQNASQNITINSVATTTGTGGSLASTARYNCVNLICTVANTTWCVVSSSGILTVT